MCYIPNYRANSGLENNSAAEMHHRVFLIQTKMTCMHENEEFICMFKIEKKNSAQ